MILIDDEYNDEKLKKAKLILEENNIKNIRTIPFLSNFASTRWSIDDLDEIEDLKYLPLGTKIDFMDFASDQIVSDMIERGWESIDVLSSLYIKTNNILTNPMIIQ